MNSHVPHSETPPPVDNGILSKRYVERHQFDAEYVRRLTDCEPATEKHFVEYFGDLLTAKLRFRLRHADMAEDARQETLLRVLKYLRTGRGIDTPHALGAFVNSVCNNVLRETYRAETKSPTLTEEIPDVPCKDASVETQLVEEQNRIRVRRVLAELPEKDRDILFQIFFEERSKDEVCRQFQVDREYLRVLVHRAKIRFRAGFAKAQGA